MDFIKTYTKNNKKWVSKHGKSKIKVNRKNNNERKRDRAGATSVTANLRKGRLSKVLTTFYIRQEK